MHRQADRKATARLRLIGMSSSTTGASGKQPIATIMPSATDLEAYMDRNEERYFALFRDPLGVRRENWLVVRNYIDRVKQAEAGLAAAAARGRQGGCKPVVTPDKLTRARGLLANGLTVREAATGVGVGQLLNRHSGQSCTDAAIY